MRILSQKVFLLALLFASVSCSGAKGDSKYDGMDLFQSDYGVSEVKAEPTKEVKKTVKEAAKKNETKIAASPEAKAEVVEKVEPTPQKVVEEKKSAKSDPLKTLNVSKVYTIDWVNMTVAYFVADIKTSGDDVTFKFHSVSSGFVDKLANFGWSSLTKAKFNGHDFTPVSVDRISELKKKSRNIKIAYDAKGNVTSDSIDPAENRAKRPVVPQNEKDKTYDVLTLFLEARAQVIDIFRENKFTNNAQGIGEAQISLPLYDGRKRSDIELTIYNNINDNQFKVRVRQKAVSGYTQNELKDSKKGDKYVDVFVDNVNYIPMKASGKSPMGSARAAVKKDCLKTFEECIADAEKDQ